MLFLLWLHSNMKGKYTKKLKRDFQKISKRDCARILNALFAMASIVWEPLQIRPVLNDPADDKILECAISGGCTHIVTFDKKHFPLAILARYGVKGMNAGEFLQIWRDNV